MQEQTALKEADYARNAPGCYLMKERLFLPPCLSTIRLLFSYDIGHCVCFWVKKKCVGLCVSVTVAEQKVQEKNRTGPVV